MRSVLSSSPTQKATHHMRQRLSSTQSVASVSHWINTQTTNCTCYPSPVSHIHTHLQTVQCLRETGLPSWAVGMQHLRTACTDSHLLGQGGRDRWDAACLCFTNNQIREEHLLAVYEQFFLGFMLSNWSQLVWLGVFLHIPQEGDRVVDGGAVPDGARGTFSMHSNFRVSSSSSVDYPPGCRVGFGLKLRFWMRNRY